MNVKRGSSAHEYILQEVMNNMILRKCPDLWGEKLHLQEAPESQWRRTGSAVYSNWNDIDSDRGNKQVLI